MKFNNPKIKRVYMKNQSGKLLSGKIRSFRKTKKIKNSPERKNKFENSLPSSSDSHLNTKTVSKNHDSIKKSISHFRSYSKNSRKSPCETSLRSERIKKIPGREEGSLLNKTVFNPSFHRSNQGDTEKLRNNLNFGSNLFIPPLDINNEDNLNEIKARHNITTKAKNSNFEVEEINNTLPLLDIDLIKKPENKDSIPLIDESEIRRKRAKSKSTLNHKNPTSGTFSVNEDNNDGRLKKYAKLLNEFK